MSLFDPIRIIATLVQQALDAASFTPYGADQLWRDATRRRAKAAADAKAAANVLADAEAEIEVAEPNPDADDRPKWQQVIDAGGVPTLAEYVPPASTIHVGTFSGSIPAVVGEDLSAIRGYAEDIRNLLNTLLPIDDSKISAAAGAPPSPGLAAEPPRDGCNYGAGHPTSAAAEASTHCGPPAERPAPPAACCVAPAAGAGHPTLSAGDLRAAANAARFKAAVLRELESNPYAFTWIQLADRLEAAADDATK